MARWLEAEGFRSQRLKWLVDYACRDDYGTTAEGVSAWAILVSEVMLQQTPVVRVLPHWQEWMERWPSPAALADAPTAEVLR